MSSFAGSDSSPPTIVVGAINDPVWLIHSFAVWMHRCLHYSKWFHWNRSPPRLTHNAHTHGFSVGTISLNKHPFPPVLVNANPQFSYLTPFLRSFWLCVVESCWLAFYLILLDSGWPLRLLPSLIQHHIHNSSLPFSWKFVYWLSVVF